MTSPEEYKRRFLVPAPKSAEWKTVYIDGRLHRRIAMLVRASGCGSISGFIIRLLELHMEEHREDIAGLLGEVYRPWDDEEWDGPPVNICKCSKRHVNERKERERPDGSRRNGRGAHPWDNGGSPCRSPSGTGAVQPSVYGDEYLHGIASVQRRSLHIPAALHRKLSILAGASENGKVTLEGFINHLVSRHLEEYRETSGNDSGGVPARPDIKGRMLAMYRGLRGMNYPAIWLS